MIWFWIWRILFILVALSYLCYRYPRFRAGTIRFSIGVGRFLSWLGILAGRFFRWLGVQGWRLFIWSMVQLGIFITRGIPNLFRWAWRTVVFLWTYFIVFPLRAIRFCINALIDGYNNFRRDLILVRALRALIVLVVGLMMIHQLQGMYGFEEKMNQVFVDGVLLGILACALRLMIPYRP